MSDDDRLSLIADDIAMKIRDLTGPNSDQLTADCRYKLARTLRSDIYELGKDLCDAFDLRWVGYDE